MSPDVIWATILLAGLGYEGYALFNKAEGDTLSERTRDWFNVKTSKPGRAAFLVLWVAFAAWFLPHILTGQV